MGWNITKNKDKYNIYSTVTESFVYKNLTRNEVIVLYITEDIIRSNDNTVRLLNRIDGLENKFNILPEAKRNQIIDKVKEIVSIIKQVI